MRKHGQNSRNCPQYNIYIVEKNSQDTKKSPRKAEKPDIDERIYNILDKAEKISVKLAQINEIRKKYNKKKKKKYKKNYKIDKKTGPVLLKKDKKAKKAKALKKYKPPKKKK